MLFRRIACVLLAVLLLVPAGAMAEGETFTLAGFDDTSMRQWENNRFFARMHEWTGVDFTFRQSTDLQSWNQWKAALTKDSKDLPDVLFKAALTNTECVELRANGTLIDLKPLLEANAPHAWAVLQEQPDVLDAITLPDGSIAALPYINTLPSQNYIWINRQWLETLRLETPVSAEDLVTVLTAFKTRDPNRNGKNDEIPLGFLGPFDLKFLAHAFGMICNDYNLFVDEQGQARFMPLEENYRMFVTWCRDLYSASLLDPNGFSTADTLRKVTDDKALPLYGAILTTNPANLFKTSWADQYTPLAPLMYEGKQIYRDFFGPVQTGTFAITSACRDPEKILAWVDILYTEEGAKLTAAGQENLDYLVDGDGTWRLVDTAQSNASLFVANSLMDGGASMPGIAAADFIRRFSGQSQNQLENMEKQTQMRVFCVRPFPYVYLTKAQEEEIAPLQNKIGLLVDLQLARWVLGEEEITDASFEKFEQDLNDAGLSAFLSFWQGVLESK